MYYMLEAIETNNQQMQKFTLPYTGYPLTPNG